MTTKYLATDIAWDEAPGGVPVLHAYPDPITKREPWTIGFGSTGPDITWDTMWTSSQAYLRRNETIEDLITHFKAQWPWWDAIGDVRQDVLVNMGYQMGFAGVLKFTSTLAAEARGAWETVSADMRASLWDRQTHGRAERLAEQARTSLRVPRAYDKTIDALTPVLVTTVPAQPKEKSIMSLVSDALTFVWDHTFAANARAAASVDPVTAAAGIAAITGTPQETVPVAPSSNSTAGLASGPIKAFEDAINDAVAGLVKTGVDQLPGVGAVAEVTGLDQKAADAAKAFLVLAEQHGLTFLSNAFSRGHVAVDSVTAGQTGKAGS